MAESTQAIATRCLEDASFARQTLEGDDYPEVRGAIITDLEAEASVKGYLNPQPMPPGERAFALSAWAEQARIWNNWVTLDRVNLRRIAHVR